MSLASWQLPLYCKRYCVSGVVKFGRYLWTLPVCSFACLCHFSNIHSLGNTNASRFEVYALLGETYGSGCPLGYLLIQSSDDAEEGGKEQYLRDLLLYVKETWKLRALITLTDKDLSEINAFLAVYPEASISFAFGIAYGLSRQGSLFSGEDQNFMMSSRQRGNLIGLMKHLSHLHKQRGLR